MSKVYDAANKLADEIRNSDEFLKYREARKDVLANPEFKSRIEEFEKIRYDVQVLSMEKGSTDPEELYTILVENKDIKEYFDLEVNFNIMVADVNKIIAESMQEIFSK